jgi:hypothetical protein
VKGTFEVHEGVPEELAQGLGAKPGLYDAALRISNEPSAILDDTARQPRGLGLRVFGVPGVPIDGQIATTINQDFLFNNAPNIELRDIRQSCYPLPE